MITLEDTLLTHFSNMEDPRCSSHRNFQYSLDAIFIISVLAVICGANNWTEIEQFGQDKEAWLKTFLELPYGIPSHDTFSRVFALLNPAVFESHFNAWISSLTVDLRDEIIALDGKTLRGSGNKRQGKKPIHMVHAWAAKQRLLLAQVKTHEKSNEITAMPEVLKLLDINGGVVTIDAMGCQQALAQQIIRQTGNYVLSLKENQRNLLKDVKAIFDEAESGEKPYKKVWHRRKVVKKHGHGRVETRRYTLVSSKDKNVGFSLRFPGLRGLVKLEVTRTTHHQVERITRYFVTSLFYDEIDRLVEAIEHHWQIEIDLHWSLDVSFQEDLNQVHIGHSAQNLGLIRRITLNLLKQEKTHKRGITCRRKTAGWNHQYLLKVLAGSQSLEIASG